MAQPLSIESKDFTYFITNRTAGSRLLFINNKHLENRILGCLARYQEIYKVIIYSFILMGNHYHLVASFPLMNRASFMRDFNSAFARLVGRYVKVHGRRSVWARRYSYQILPRPKDIKHWFFYAALNPVTSGLLKDVTEYPSYNSFFHAAAGVNKVYKWVDYSAYLMKKRFNHTLTEEDFTKEYTLTFSRLPGYEEMSDAEYADVLGKELKERNKKAVKDRLAQGKGFLGLEKLLMQKPGSYPKTTKQSSRNSFRPIVLSLCNETKRKVLEAYFYIRDKFLEASKAYRAGDFASAVFPPGTYKPPVLCCQ